MEIIDVVRKLVGPIEPVADSAIDDSRMRNLQQYCLLAEKMLFDIWQVSKTKDSHFYSMKEIGEHAYKFLHQLKDMAPEPPKPSKP